MLQHAMPIPVKLSDLCEQVLHMVNHNMGKQCDGCIVRWRGGCTGWQLQGRL